MKKILAALLAVLMLASMLVACKPDEPDETDPPKPSDTKVPPVSTPDPSESTPEGTDTPTEPPVVDEVTFVDVDETVYVVKILNGVDVEGLRLRNTLSFDSVSNIKYSVAAGAELKRTGVHETWSRVEYKGETLYCSTKYLTTEKPGEATDPNWEETVKFTEVDETVYAYAPDSAIWYYSIPVHDPEYRVNTLKDGTEIKRTGIYYENPEDPEKLGWSRIVVDGNVYYTRNSVVTTAKPAA